MRNGLLQIRYLGFEKVVRDDQRANSRARIAVANSDRWSTAASSPSSCSFGFKTEDMALFQVDRRRPMFLFCSHGVKPPF